MAKAIKGVGKFAYEVGKTVLPTAAGTITGALTKNPAIA